MKKVLALSLVAFAGMMVAVPAPVARAAAVMNARAGEMIDNPEFKNWSKFKPGTTVKVKMVSDMAGNKTEMTMTHKLVEAGAEKCVVETTTSMKMGDQTFDQPAQKRDVPAKVEKVETKGEDKDAPKPKEGEETITVAGKEYKAKWTEMTVDQNGMKSTTKSWTSEEFPGMILKSETKLEGAVSGTTSMEVVEVTMG